MRTPKAYFLANQVAKKGSKKDDEAEEKPADGRVIESVLLDVVRCAVSSSRSTPFRATLSTPA